MTSILWALFELIVTLFECSVSMHFVCKFLGLDFADKTNRKLWYGIVLCYAMAVSMMNYIVPYEGALVFIYSTIVFLYSAFLLPGTLVKKLIASVLFLCIVIMNSSLGVNLVSSILDSSASEIYKESDFARFITLVFVQSLNLLVFQILEKTIGSSVLKLQLREWILFGGTFILSILGMTLIQIAVTQLDASNTIRLYFLGADLAIIVVNYITIRLISALDRQHQTELENQQMRMQVRYQTQYAETVRQQEESVHRLRHDMKSTISALYEFLHKKQLTQMEAYLDNYTSSLSETASIVHTNQPFLNAILNTKMTYAKECGIACTCHSPVNLPTINGTDYCSLLGNLLDNAIEAELHILNPALSVDIDYRNSRLMILVRNRIQGSVLKTNPKLLTTKDKTVNHGHGVPTIQEIINRYNGTVDFYEEDNWFIASLVLYIEQ